MGEKLGEARNRAFCYIASREPSLSEPSALLSPRTSVPETFWRSCEHSLLVIPSKRVRIRNGKDPRPAWSLFRGETTFRDALSALSSVALKSQAHTCRFNRQAHCSTEVRSEGLPCGLQSDRIVNRHGYLLF